MDELAQALVLQQVVLGEPQMSVVDCVGFGTELGVDVEQALEGFLPGEPVVQLGQQLAALGERLLQSGFLLGVVCVCLLVVRASERAR